VADRKWGVLLANRGLPEFEVLRHQDGGVTLGLTLLRCVGWLSRDDLSTRPRHAGPGIATPGAQTFGVHHFDYAIVPFTGSWLDSRAYLAAQSFSSPLYGSADPLQSGPMPSTASLN
jgi:mannosylglycerate hydrolase